MAYTLNDLLHLMRRLRSDEGGCPWDRAQTYSSIAPHTLEEVYEVIDALEREDWCHLKDELGDLLFQIIFYARLAEEDAHFDFAAIVDGLVVKLLRRHPHVFTDGSLYGSVGEAPCSQEQVRENWEAIKQQERAHKQRHGQLDDVPLALPALMRAAKLQKRAAAVGFDWPDPLPVLDKLEEELAELREALQQGDRQQVSEELGDLLFAQVNLCRHLRIDPEQALRGSNRKFERRFAYVEQQVWAGGGDWNAYTLEQLDSFWDQAKQREADNE